MTALSANEWVVQKDGINYIKAAPKLKFPYQIGVLRAKITDPNHPYISIGYFFEQGHIFSESDLSAHDYNRNIIDLQLKPMNHYKDGSVRFGLLTLKFKHFSPSQFYNIALLEQAPQKKKPHNISFALPDLKIKITTDHNKSKTISLKNNSAMERYLWHKGPLLYQKRYYTPISTNLIAEFDVSFFDNGHKKIDVALKHTSPEAKQILNYKADFLYKGKRIRAIPLTKHYPHTIKRYQFHMGYKKDNHAILDMNALIKLGALPSYDIHQGIKSNAVMTDISGRQSIIHQVNAHYITLQTPQLKEKMLKNAQTLNLAPIYFTDMQTQKFISKKDFGKIKTTVDKSYPIASYVPFIMTGERQYYDHLKAYFIYTRLKAYKKQSGHKTNLNIKDYIDIRKASAFLNSVSNEKDTYLDLKNYLEKDWSFLNNSVMTYQTIQQERYSLGSLVGATFLEHDTENDFIHMQNQDLLGLVTGFEANLNIFPKLKGFSHWQSQFLVERFLQKRKVFSSFYGFASHYSMKENGRYFQKWKDIAIHSYNTEPFKKITGSLSQETLPYQIKYAILLAAATQAQLYNTTGNINALEAYGTIATYFPRLKQDILEASHLRITPFINGKKPLKNTHILMGQKENDNFTDIPENSLIHGRAGNDFLSVKNGSSYLFGGDGNDQIQAGSSDSVLFGGNGKDLLIAGTGDDIMKGDAKRKIYRDIFKFVGPIIGQNVIVDFTPGIDKIHISPKLNIAQYQYSNRLEGLSFDRRRGGKERDPKCDKLSQEEQDKREECLKYRRYYNAGLVPFEYIKELRPDIQKFIQKEKKRLEKSIQLLKYDPSSKRYKRDFFEYKRIIAQEIEINKEEQTRLELSQLSQVTDLGKYRQKENELNNILATKNIIINNILAASRFGDSSATKLLNPKPITNIGLKNYFRPAANSSTVIDFNINVTPEEHLKNSNDPISNRIGSILIKGIPPEKLTRDNFIFGY